MSEQTASVGIPGQVDDITVDWLNTALADDERFGTIVGVDTAHFAEGVGILGELARLSLTYAAGETGPPTVVAKCQSPAPESVFLASMMGFYLREVSFYQHVAGDVSIPVAQPYLAECGDGGIPFVLLIEDVVGATCPDQIAGLSVDEVETIISTITPLHTQFWGTDELFGLSWLPPMNNDLYKGGQVMATERFPGFAEHFGDRVDPAFMNQIGHACDRYAEMLDHLVSLGTPTFTHTDCRAENYLFGGRVGGEDRDVTVVDFQLSTRHWGMWDVTNLLAGSMDPELRREHEHAVIERYVERVRAAGIDYDLDQAMLEYRLCLLQQTTAQVITHDLQGGNERGTELLEQLHLRPVLAAQDHRVGDLLSTF